MAPVRLLKHRSLRHERRLSGRIWRLPAPLSFAILLAAGSLQLCGGAGGSTQSRPTNAIRLNTVGYLPESVKIASVARSASGFKIVRTSNGHTAYQAILRGPTLNPDTGEYLYFADFSDVSTEGQYRLEVEGVGVSPPFTISTDVYVQPYRLAARAMYLWRCGVAVRGEHNGDVFFHQACHTEDAWGDYAGLGHRLIPATGGWHDAGDYNKYVTNAGITVASLLLAHRMFGSRLGSIGLDLPESGGDLPDLLSEVRFETDWVLKMQASDGGVFHKLSTKSFGGFTLPEQEKAERFLVPVGTAATANFVAMTAMAAKEFEAHDPTYARRLLEAAEKSAKYLSAHPGDLASDQTGFSTGTYATKDEDDRMWASAEMWDATGDARHLDDFEARARRRETLVEADWDWGRLGNLGIFTYLLSDRPGRDPQLLDKALRSLIRCADQLVANAQGHGYGRALPRYYWGANGTVARQVITLTLADRLQPKPNYLRTAQMAVDHLLGRNVYGRSWVTGLGHQPPLHPHDRRSAGDSVEAPWPGYLVGGGHPSAMDWHDEQTDYRTNEIAINWQAALIYALAVLTPQKPQSAR